MTKRLENAAAEGLFNDGIASTVLSSVECPSCGCTGIANGYAAKQPEDGCDCRCHDSWRFINRVPVG